MSASGPSLRALPPVTVTLWKVSPLGARKNASGFFEGEGARGFCVGRDVAFAQLGQDDFERAAEAVEDLDAVLEWASAAQIALGTAGLAVCVCGRVVFMDEEGGAAVDGGLEQADAGGGGVPSF